MIHETTTRRNKEPGVANAPGQHRSPTEALGVQRAVREIVGDRVHEVLRRSPNTDHVCQRNSRPTGHIELLRRRRTYGALCVDRPVISLGRLFFRITAAEMLGPAVDPNPSIAASPELPNTWSKAYIRLRRHPAKFGRSGITESQTSEVAVADRLCLPVGFTFVCRWYPSVRGTAFLSVLPPYSRRNRMTE